MNARPLPAILVVLALLVAAIGCGEKDEPEATGATSATATTTTGAPSTTTTPAGQLSAAEYVAAADGLCGSAMAQQEQLRRERGGRQITLRDRARLLVQLAPARVRLAAGLGALDPPPGLRPQAEKLVASAERRGVASTRAGKLFEGNGSRAEIAAAAAAEHDERELFVEIARKLDMADCAEVLPPKQIAEVRAAIEAGLGSKSPAKRCAALGERYLAERYKGSLQTCVKQDTGGGAVEVAAIEGMDGVFAQAIADVGGRGRSTQYRVRVTYEDGAYKIDKLD